MKHVIVVNPLANQVKRNPALLKNILSDLHQHADIIYSETIEEMQDRLELAGRRHPFSDMTIYIVGGDGTFKQMLDWIIQRMESNRPILMPVGGGQFNFMTKFVGFSSGDPVKNLTRVFLRQSPVQQKPWRPISIHDSLTNTNRYGAVMANGVVSDSIELYEKNGKGNMVGVTRLIAAICADHVKSSWNQTQGRVNHTHGIVTIDGTEIDVRRQATLIVGAVNKFLPSCHPFRSELEPNRCGCILYWGNLSPLALSVPAFWFGTASPFTDKETINANVGRITLVTRDARMILDGDFFVWGTPEGTFPERTFTITRGPEIQLLHAV